MHPDDPVAGTDILFQVLEKGSPSFYQLGGLFIPQGCQADAQHVEADEQVINQDHRQFRMGPQM